MKVSIITATYNSEASIRSALSSVASQTYPDIELVVIDGGSSDTTVAIVEDFYKRPVRIISEKDKGIYDALNKGIREATGDVIGLVHSDDFLASETIIEEVVAAFKAQQVDGVYGDLQYVQKEDTSKILRYWKSERFNPGLLIRGWMPAHPSLFLKREVYEKHGSFDLAYRIAADYDFILRVFKDKSLKFHYLPKVVTKMRVGGASNRSLKNIKLKSTEDYRALKANGVGWPFITLAYKNFSKLGQFFHAGGAEDAQRSR